MNSVKNNNPNDCSVFWFVFIFSLQKFNIFSYNFIFLVGSNNKFFFIKYLFFLSSEKKANITSEKIKPKYEKSERFSSHAHFCKEFKK